MHEKGPEGISLWLYRVIRDDQRLNDPPLRPIRTAPADPSAPAVDFLVTPLTNRDHEGDPEDGALPTGQGAAGLSQPADRAGGRLKEQLAGTDTELHVRLESMSLDEITKVWEALEGSYQLCVSYEVSVVEVASDLEPEAVTPVTIALPEFSVITG